MKRMTIPIALLFLFFGISCKHSKDQNDSIAKLSLSDLKPLGEVDERYQSVNVEMCEVVGGDFWIPYNLIDTARVKAEGFSALKRTIPSINLYDKKLRNLAAGLGPMYVRVSGTWANTTYFQDNDEPKLAAAPEGYENVLTREEWKGAIDFCREVDAKLVTSFAISGGIRDNAGNWTPAQVEPLINYTKSIGGEIYAAEMFNEPSHASYGGAPGGYDGDYYAKDFARFKNYIESAIPEMKIMGPGSTGEGGILGEVGVTSESILASDPKVEFEIFSYHFYGGVSRRCRGQLSPDNALSAEWLSKTELGLKYYEEARDQYLPQAPIWLTETAEAACGGNPWAATYADSFRYLEQLGRLAKKGVQVVMHNTLAASEYALMEHDTHDPRPNYWAALLWNRLMGTTVYDADTLAQGVDVFVHNLKNSSEGLSVMIINIRALDFSFVIPSEAEQYLLTANELITKTVKLNGKVLELNPDDTLPEIKGEKTAAGEVVIPAQGIMFLSFDGK
jgi:hypothetical protein